MSITLVANHVIRALHFNSNSMQGAARNKYTACNNLCQGLISTWTLNTARWAICQAAEFAESGSYAATLSLRVGTASNLWPIPLAIAILASLRGIGDLTGTEGSNLKFAFEKIDDALRYLPGANYAIAAAAWSVGSIIQIISVAAACLAAYSTGGYLAIALAAFTIFDTLAKIDYLSQSQKHLNARLSQALFGLTFFWSEGYLFRVFGAKVMLDVINNRNIRPFMVFTDQFSVPPVSLIEDDTTTLAGHPQREIAESFDTIALNETHIHPALLPKELNGINLNEFNFKELVDAIWDDMADRLDESVIKMAINGEIDIYNDWKGNRPDTFETQKAFLRKGHCLCIGALAKQRREGNPRQETLAKAAAIAVRKKNGREQYLAQHSFLVTLGLTGHFCSTRKGEGIDSLVSGYLSSNASKLSTKIEGVLRDKRSELFKEIFIGRLRQEEVFGDGKDCDLSNVHYHYALIYVAGLNLGLNEYWGAHNEVEEMGSPNVRIVQEAYQKCNIDAELQLTFKERYSTTAIIEALQESISSTAYGKLQFNEVEAWFTDWILRNNKTPLDASDQEQMAHIQAAVETLEILADADIEALSTAIEPNLSASRRRFVEALVQERCTSDQPNYERAYAKAKATQHFQENSMEEDFITLKKEWIATMLLEMGILKIDMR